MNQSYRRDGFYKYKRYIDKSDENCIRINEIYRLILKKREGMSIRNRIRVMERRLDYLERICLPDCDNKLIYYMVDRYDYESIIK